MSTRTRLILEINGNKYRGGSIRPAIKERLKPVFNRLTSQYEHSVLKTIPDIQAAVKRLAKQHVVKLWVLREPRKVTPQRSLYKTMLGLHKTKKRASFYDPGSTRRLREQLADVLVPETPLPWSINPTSEPPGPNMVWNGVRWIR